MRAAGTGTSTVAHGLRLRSLATASRSSSSRSSSRSSDSSVGSSSARSSSAARLLRPSSATQNSNRHPPAAVSMSVSRPLAPLSTAVTKVPGRSSIPDEAVANPHHVVKNGTVVKFRNPYESWRDQPIFSSYIWPTLLGRLKGPDRSAPKPNVVKPEFLASRFSSATASPTVSPGADGAIRATWLGHACYYVEYPSGLRVLFDPVFEDCCSPFPASLIGPRRYTEPPCGIKDLPAVDAVVISHSHYDHLSYPTAMELRQHHPRAQFFVGLGLERWFRKQGIENVTELDWWEEAELTVKVREDDGKHPEDGPEDVRERTITAKVSCLPCQHTSARHLFDKDTTLWCSWAIRSGDDSVSKSVWFGGDTGYRAVPPVYKGGFLGGVDDSVDYNSDEYTSLPRCPQFKQIGDLRGPFDLGLIPIGAYKPRAAFAAMHADPFDAVEIFGDTRCRRAMGIHWGTWVLTAEELQEPPRLLKEAMRRKGLPEEGVFDVCEIGESRTF